MTWLVTRLPHPCICLRPVVGRLLGQSEQQVADLVAELDLVAQQPGGEQHLTEDVELALLPRVVADANGRAVTPSTQMVQLVLGEVSLAFQAVDDLQRAVAEIADRIRQPDEEPSGFVRTRPHPQRLHGQADVAQPGEAVVPVEGSADLLR